MGCAISCSIFETFSTFLHWLIVQKSGLNSLDHYLDDFIFMGEQSTNNCTTLMNCFANICKELGIPLATEKTIGPTRVLTFLGLETNTINKTVSVPQEKLLQLKQMITEILGKKKIRLKQMQALVGLLSFCSRAVRAGRAFLRRFYDTMIGIIKSYYFIRLTKEVKEDLRVWLQFLEKFNGIGYFPSNI